MYFKYLLALVLTPCIVFSQQLYYPEQEWLSLPPKDLNLKGSMIDSAIQLALRSENSVEKDLRLANINSYVNEPDYKILGPMKARGGPSGLIIKEGFIVGQWGDPARVDMCFSATKSFLSTIAGIAHDQGLIKNMEEPVSNYVWDDTYAGDHNKKVTWSHLLQQNSDWSGTLFGLHDWADRPPKTGGIDDWKNRTLNEPGTVYEYNDVRVNLLSYSLLQVFRKPLPVVLKENIMDHLSASTTWRWMGYDHAYVNVDGLMVQSVSGGGHHGGGLFINTYDMARFGLLFLRNGKWKNMQLLSNHWIQKARVPSVTNKNYGYLWWLNTDKTWTAVSDKVYYALGFGGNYIIIDQEHDLVVVARWMNPDKINEVLAWIIKSMH